SLCPWGAARAEEKSRQKSIESGAQGSPRKKNVGEQTGMLCLRHWRAVTSVAFLVEDKGLLIGRGAWTVGVWDVREGKKSRSSTGTGAEMKPLPFLRTGSSWLRGAFLFTSMK